MSFRNVLIVAIIIIAIASPALCQNWNSARTGTSTVLDSVFENGSYTWTFRNVSGQPADGTSCYDILAWSLQPFNLPAPSSVTAPAGWVWVDSDGWSRFELADKKLKYSVMGPALEPGESLVFVYTPAAGGQIANPGGPGNVGMSFITHIGAIKPKSAGMRWVAAEYLGESQWHEIVNTGGNNMAPEPSGVVALIVGFAGLIRVFHRSASRS